MELEDIEKINKKIKEDNIRLEKEIEEIKGNKEMYMKENINLEAEVSLLEKWSMVEDQ